MRYFVIIGILCALAPAAFAQAADPNAIDLSGKMDTIARGSYDLQNFKPLIGFLNVGLQNADQWEDFEIDYGAQIDYGRMRFGGPMIFDTTNNPLFDKYPKLAGDINKSGKVDIIDADFFTLYKNLGKFPYFDTSHTMQFAFHDTKGSEGIIDFDEDGYPDVIGAGVDSKNYFITLYKGGADFGSQKFMYPSDSIVLPPHGYDFTTIGKFGPHQKPSVLLTKGKAITIIKNTAPSLFEDSTFLISDTSIDGIAYTNLYATDITGDGVTDLICSDGLHIYIFKGGDDFGTYPLTPKNAFYTITSPLVRDFGHWPFLTNDFGNYMKACGDLTGSGTPYLAVESSTNPQALDRHFAFFYAGGKALDTLYDAVIGYYDIGLDMDTLHSVNSSGRTVCTIIDFNDMYFKGNIDLLMSRDCENIPHTTNPDMVGVSRAIKEEFTVTCFPAIDNKFTKIQIVADKFSEATITVFNLLGQEIQKRMIQLDRGGNTEFFDTTDWIGGTYIVKVETSSGIEIAKVIVRH